jgi:hypothetical protein
MTACRHAIDLKGALVDKLATASSASKGDSWCMGANIPVKARASAPVVT